MFTKQSTCRNITLITAFAVLWVFLGALLNFHANRILGTELIDQTYPAIKPKSKESTAQLADLIKKINQHDSFTFVNSFDVSESLFPAALVKKQEIAISTLVKVRTYHFGLRAPPTL